MGIELLERPVAPLRDITDRPLDPSELEWLATGRSFEFEDPATGRRLLLPTMRGGGPGAGGVYLRNLPSGQGYVIHPERFAVETQRNFKTYAGQAWPGYAQRLSWRLDKTGVVARVWLHFEGTLAPGAMTPTAAGGYPFNLIRRIKVSANGISNLIYFDGWDARALARIRNKLFNDREVVYTLPTGGGATLPLRLDWEIPLAYDDSLIGAVFCQTEDTELTVELELAGASTELFATNAPTVAGTFTPVVEFFSIPLETSQEKTRLILPDIRQLHGITSKDDAVTGAGEHTANLMRTGGILLRALQRLDNIAPSIGNYDLAANCSSHKFRYGSTQVVFDISGRIKRAMMQMDYGDSIMPAVDVVSGTAPQYLVDDFVADSPVRDVIHLLGVSEPQLLNQLTVAPTAGATMHTVQEHMVGG